MTQTSIPRPEFPRPQFFRGEERWLNLNGTWEYAITSAVSDVPTKSDGTILVPFGVETPLSGVRRKVLPEDQIWYRRTFNVHPQRGYRTILNFECVDFRAHVFVNGQEATDVPHEGGNVPFSVDVTPFVKDGEKLAWGNKDRGGIYLEYNVDFGTKQYAIRDTLVSRSREVVMETYSPVFKK